MISNTNKPALLTNYPQLSDILIETDVVEFFGESLTYVVTEVGAIRIAGSIITQMPVEPMPVVRNIADDSPLYFPMLALEMARLNLIHAALSQGETLPPNTIELAA